MVCKTVEFCLHSVLIAAYFPLLMYFVIKNYYINRLTLVKLVDVGDFNGGSFFSFAIMSASVFWGCETDTVLLEVVDFVKLASFIWITAGDVLGVLESFRTGTAGFWVVRFSVVAGVPANVNVEIIDIHHKNTNPAIKAPSYANCVKSNSKFIYRVSM